MIIKKLFLTISKISLSSVVSIVTGLLKTKIFAVILGTAGLGISSQLVTLNNLVIFIGTLGLPTGLAKNISQWETENENEKINKILGSVILLLVLISVFLCVFVLVFQELLSVLLFGNIKYFLLVVLIAFSFPFISTISILEAYLRGLKKFSYYVKLSIIYNILSLLISAILVYYYGVSGVAFSILISSIIGLSVYIYYLKKKYLLNIIFPKKLNEIFTDTFKNVISWGVASLIIGFSDNLVLLVIRSLIINNAGLEANGIYQVVNSISNNYISVFFMAISIYIIPVFAGLKGKEELNKEINAFFRLTLFLVIPIISFTFIFREILILLLYSSAFLSASKLFIYSFLGDFFKALCWVMGVWLIPSNKIKAWVIVGVLYNVNYFIIFIICFYLFNLNIESAVIGYLLTNIITFVINYILLKMKNGFEFISENKIGFWSSFSALIVILTVSSSNIKYGYILLVPVISFWLYLNINKNEFIKIKEYLSKILIKQNNV